MKRTILAAAALVATAAPQIAAADWGPYIGGTLGSATLTDNFEGFDVDEDSTAYRVFAGFNFGDTFGLETGYHRFGTFEEDLAGRFRLDADGMFLGGKLGLPLSENAKLIGRGGWFFWDDDSILNDIRRINDDESYLYLGLGAEVELSPNLSLTGDWTRYELDYTDSDVISIGLTLHF